MILHSAGPGEDTVINQHEGFYFLTSEAAWLCTLSWCNARSCPISMTVLTHAILRNKVCH